MGSNIFWDLNNSAWLYFAAFFEPIIKLLLVFVGLIILFVIMGALLAVVATVATDAAEGGIVFAGIIFVGGMMVLGTYSHKWRVEEATRLATEGPRFISEVAKVVSPSYYWSLLILLIIIAFLALLIAVFVHFSDDLGVALGYAAVLLGLAYIVHFVTFDNPTLKLYKSVTRSTCAVYYYTCADCRSEKVESLLTCGVPDAKGYPKSYLDPKGYKFIQKSAFFPIQKLHQVYFKQGWYLFQSLPSNIKGTVYSLLALIGAILAYALFMGMGRTISEGILLKRVQNIKINRNSPINEVKNGNTIRSTKLQTKQAIEETAASYMQAMREKAADLDSKTKKSLDRYVREAINAEKVKSEAEFSAKGITYMNEFNKRMREIILESVQKLGLEQDKEMQLYLKIISDIHSQKLHINDL